MLENATNWKLPDGLSYSSLRPVQLTRHGKLLAGLMVAFVMGGLALGLFLSSKARKQAAEQRWLSGQGRTTEATVTRTWIDDSKERQRWISYRFEVDGSIYTHRVQTPRKVWDTLAKGSAMPVRFVPARPSISHPVAWEAQILPFWLAVVLPFLLIGPAVLILLSLRLQARLLAEGRPAPGRVTEVKRADKHMRVTYEFRMLNGAVGKGRSNTHRPPVVGSSVCVMYDPENPRRNALYPMTLVRLENARSK